MEAAHLALLCSERAAGLGKDMMLSAWLFVSLCRGQHRQQQAALADRGKEALLSGVGTREAAVLLAAWLLCCLCWQGSSSSCVLLCSQFRLGKMSESCEGIEGIYWKKNLDFL